MILVLVNPDINAQIRYESHLANLVRYNLLTPEEFSRETGREVPPQVPVEQPTNKPVDGTFSAISTPVNQNTDDSTVVLDEVIVEDEEKLFPKMFYFIEDNIKDALPNEDSIELASQLTSLTLKYKNLGVDSKTISNTLWSLLEEKIVSQLC